MDKKKNMNNQGFSFIEVLVVSTIIAVLTAVGVSNFRIANQKSRDGKRQGDLEQIRAALELYRTDQNDYPTTGEWPGTGGALSASGTTYMSVIPSDPKTDYDYYYSSDGLTYTLCVSLELGELTACGSGDCGAGTCNYEITNPL